MRRIWREQMKWSSTTSKGWSSSKDWYRLWDQGICDSSCWSGSWKKSPWQQADDEHDRKAQL